LTDRFAFETLEQLSLGDHGGKLTAICSKCPKSDPLIYQEMRILLTMGKEENQH
jgi:hypothetical protein